MDGAFKKRKTARAAWTIVAAMAGTAVHAQGVQGVPAPGAVTVELKADQATLGKTDDVGVTVTLDQPHGHHAIPAGLANAGLRRPGAAVRRHARRPARSLPRHQGQARRTRTRRLHRAGAGRQPGRPRRAVGAVRHARHRRLQRTLPGGCRAGVHQPGRDAGRGRGARLRHGDLDRRTPAARHPARAECAGRAGRAIVQPLLERPARQRRRRRQGVPGDGDRRRRLHGPQGARPALHDLVRRRRRRARARTRSSSTSAPSAMPSPPSR